MNRTDWCKNTGRVNRSTRRKNCPDATSFNTNLTRTRLGLNPIFHGERQDNNCLCHELPTVNETIGKRRVQYSTLTENFPKGFEELHKKYQDRYSKGQNSRYEYQCLQDQQCTYNVTLKCVRPTIIALEEH